MKIPLEALFKNNRTVCNLKTLDSTSQFTLILTYLGLLAITFTCYCVILKLSKLVQTLVDAFDNFDRHFVAISQSYNNLRRELRQQAQFTDSQPPPAYQAVQETRV